MRGTLVEGPRQVWMWSRMDGTVTRHRVKPSEYMDCWVEEWSNGCHFWFPESICDSPEEATRQARQHFERIAKDAQAVLERLG